MRSTKEAPYYLRTAPRLLRLPEVMEITGLSKPTIYRMVNAGDFPKQRRLSPRCVGWFDQEVQEWVYHRPISQAVVRTPYSQLTATKRPHDGHKTSKGRQMAA